MSEIPFELSSVEVVGGRDLDIRVTAIRLCHDNEPWHLMLNALRTDLWLTWMESSTLPSKVTLQDKGHATFSAHLSLLFGDPWMEFWDEPELCLERQMTELSLLTERTKNKLMVLSAEDVLRWREERPGITDGEAMRFDLLGIPPVFGRN